MSCDLTTRRTGEVARAARAFDAIAARDPFGHRKLHAELRAGNPYALAMIARRGLSYRDGAITEAKKRLAGLQTQA